MTRFGDNCRPIRPRNAYLLTPGAAEYVHQLEAERDRYRTALENERVFWHCKKILKEQKGDTFGAGFAQLREEGIITALAGKE